MSVSGDVRALRPPSRETERSRRQAGKSSQRQVNGTSRLITLAVLILATLYFLLPVWWLVVSATKTNAALFSSNGFWFSGMAPIPERAKAGA